MGMESFVCRDLANSSMDVVCISGCSEGSLDVRVFFNSICSKILSQNIDMNIVHSDNSYWYLILFYK